MIYKFIVLLFFFICLGSNNYAQTNILGKDTVLTKRQQDRLFLNRGFADRVVKLKKSITNTWNKIFIDFTDNHVFLTAGMSLSKQNISANDYNAPFIYSMTDAKKNVFKPGYMAGFRVDGKYKEKYPYAVAFTLNKYAMGANYKEVKNFEPFIGGFSNFKAADQLFSLNVTALYKYLLPVSDTSKYKFYLVGGPSMDFRLSGQSLDNQVNNNYRNIFLRADVGIEFDNNGYYTLFFHYKQGLYSITRSSIQTQFNNFNFGMLIKASDLF